MRQYNNWKWFIAAIILIVLAVVDRFVLGQFLMQILVLPIAVIGFFWTVHQIRKAQEVTDLHLYWSTGVDQREREVPLIIPSTSVERPLRPELYNTGHLVAIWYFLEFRIPRVLAYGDEIKFSPIVGEMGDDWKRGALNKDGEEFTLFSFRSKGQEAAYPYYDLHLGDMSIRLHGNREYPKSCKVPYKIATDRGKPLKGALILKIEREADQEEGKS